MGKGEGTCAERQPMELDANQPAAGRNRRRKRERPFEHLTEEQIDRELANAEAGRLRERAKELSRELWRRPGGSGFERGQTIAGLPVVGIDADRQRIIVRVAGGGHRSLTQTQAINLMADGRIKPPTEPDKRPPPEPVDYGQYAPRPQRVPLGHQPLPDRPESAAFAAECKRIDDQRDWMSDERDRTDIVEFERLWWQQNEARLELAVAVERAGGLDPDTGMWGLRYVAGMPEQLTGMEQATRRRYEHIQRMRLQGHPDAAIIAFLEAEYNSPFGGPKPPA